MILLTVILLLSLWTILLWKYAFVSSLLSMFSQPRFQVSETCRIALDLFAERDANQSSTSCSGRFQSVDPAPPAAAQPDVGASERVRRWSEELLDTRLPLFERYKAMFALRDDGSPAAVAALCKSFADRSSALFRHEVAYVLGQLQDPLSRDALLAVLQVRLVPFWPCFAM